MIYRLIAISKHIIFGFFRLLCCILRCGRRKKVQVDDSLPTDIVIPDAVNTNLQNYPASSSSTNGYEVPSPGYYNQLQEPRHPYQSQLTAENSEQLGATDMQMQSWDQWDFDGSTAAQSSNIAQSSDPQAATQQEQEEMNFFADMEPAVKVKKIFIKKKQKIDTQHRNRFAVNQDLDFRPPATGFDDDWRDGDAEEGWTDEDADIGEIDTAKVAKEAQQLRKQERLQRSEEQKRMKLSKKSSHNKEHKLGTKVS